MKRQDKASPKTKPSSTKRGRRSSAHPEPDGIQRTAAGKPVLLITGDSRAALEYGSVAASKGYSIHLWDVTPPVVKSHLPASMKVVPTPTATAAVAMELTIIDVEMKKKRLQRLDGVLAKTAPLLSTSLSVSAVEQATWVEEKHRLVGFAGLPTFAEKSLVETAPTVFTPHQTLDAVSAFWASLGRSIELVQDRVGLVGARIICQVINEAAFALQEEIARPEDIDTAMKLGVSYPHGPFAWADRIGIMNVEAILRALQRDYQEERYRIAPLLRTMALGGEWWKRNQELIPQGAS